MNVHKSKPYNSQRAAYLAIQSLRGSHSTRHGNTWISDDGPKSWVNADNQIVTDYGKKSNKNKRNNPTK